MGCGQKKLYVIVVISEFLVNDQLPRVSRQSCVSANDKGDNELKREAVRRSSCIYLTAAENPGKFQLGGRLMKTVWAVMAPNGVPYLQMMSVGERSTSERAKEIMGKEAYVLMQFSK